VGELSIVVTVYQEDYALGSARVSTLAAERRRSPPERCRITIASQPLAGLRLRILDPIDQRYRQR
jgi:hypothetical protein